jgi:hypothetical protein
MKTSRWVAVLLALIWRGSFKSKERNLTVKPGAKPWRGIVGAFALSLLMCSPTNAQTIQIGNLQIPVANIQPVDSNSIPDQGTFYLLQDCLNYGMVAAPLPDDCCLEYPAYSLGIDGLFLVDNTGTTGETIQQLVTPLLIIPDPNAGVTNQIPWPLSLSQLTLVDPTNVPEFGTFYLYTDQLTNDSPCPLPDDPCTNCPVYSLASIGFDGIFLIDDTGFVWPEAPDLELTPLVKSYTLNSLWLEIDGVSNGLAFLVLHGTRPRTNYDMLVKQRLSDAAWTVAQIIPGSGDTNGTQVILPVGGGLNSLFFWARIQNPPSGLWLEIPTNAFGVSNELTLVLHNTSLDQEYDILTKQTLSDPTWAVEQSVLGAAADSTIITMPLSGQANLFVWARFGGSSDGSGLPDWWQLQYFGHLGVDPYSADPSGDGWNYIQDYLNGFIPGTFNTPPPPQNVSVQLDSTGMNVIISWQPTSGAVIGYEIESYFYGTLGSVGPSATRFTNALPYVYFNPNDYYSVDAIYTNGATSLNQWDGEFATDNIWQDANLVRGQEGHFCLLVTSPATNLAAVRVYNGGTDSNGQEIYFDVPISAFTNDMAILPEAQTEQYLSNTYGYYAYARRITTDGTFSANMTELLKSWWLDYNSWPQHHAFVNASAQLKQNLQFLLRSATVDRQFGLYFGYVDQEAGTVTYSLYYQEMTNDYAYSGYFGGQFDGMMPVYQNFTWRNFVFNPTDGLGIWGTPPAAESVLGWGGTGAAYSVLHDWRAIFEPKYQLQVFTNPPPLAFSLDNSSYLYYRNLYIPNDDPAAFSELGLVPYQDGSLGLNSGTRNAYGLPINSVLVLNSNTSWTVSANHPIGPLVTTESSRLFAGVTPAGLQTVKYYFDNFFLGSNGNTPGDIGFDPTNAAPFLVAGWGQPALFSGWAKQAITNGYPNTFGYLQQYFDNAYEINSNGVVTTTQAGVLSPYGEFFPTNPGPAALVTMPDIDFPSQRGTATVYCVKIQLDVNHDGVMDTSLAGSDDTSMNRPFVFWANNNYDRWHSVDCNIVGQNCDQEQDDLGADDIANLPALQQVPDGLYTSNFIPVIPCTRDLEDYARLWIPGLSSLMAALPTNYTVQLIATGGQQLKIFRAVEADGGTNYLFDEATASSQVANSSSLFLGVLASGLPIVLNGKPNLGEHFIFCCPQPGEADITLRVSDPNQNIIASTKAYIQIVDIKDMYERWTVGERPAYAPTNIAQRADEDLPSGETIPFQYPTNADASTPYILFVHGWNMETWEKDRYAEAAFKRLYWQGYQGRFGIFRWPTDHDFGPIGDSWNNAVTDPENYDRSESNAWASATGLLNLLNTLNAQYPGSVYLMAHSMGNVVAGEALRQAGTSHVVNTYVAMQAAVPAHCYDPAATTRTIPFPFDSGTPNCYAHYWTAAAPSYFNGSAGAGTYVNFYNTNDYALGTLLWQLNQDTKPDDDRPYFYSEGNFYSGYIDPSTELFFPQNTYEIFAFCDEARCYALGAQPNVGGSFIPADQVELDIAPYNFDSTHKCHSGEFRSDNMSRAVFWDRVLIRMGLKQED